VRAGLESDTQFGAVVPPVYLSSTYAFSGFGVKRGYDYSRSGNPTRDAFAAALAELEGGAGCIVTGTGMAALTLVLLLVRPGERVIAPHDCYGGTHRLLAALARTGRLQVDFIDMSRPGSIAAALATPARLLLVESPSNPLLRITDIAAATAAARARGVLSVVDNTFMSPLWQRPLELGADVVVHSTTKYLNGHSDMVGGAVIARDQALHEELAWWANCIGVTAGAFDSYLALRGLRTLALRLEQHARNALLVADMLAGHPAVAAVYYPGLPGHAGHVLAARQQSAFGAIVSFEVHGGLDAVRALVEGMCCFSLAESLGGVESLIAHPASMTHAGMAPEARREAGLVDGLLRLSVGIEDPEDLLADLRAALARAAAGIQAGS
jgi:cystathionine gamma-synthase